MLVIRRRAGESLLIGDDVEIEILALTQSHVKLGIRAPHHVPIVRKEIRLTCDQNREAFSVASLDAIWELARLLRQNGPPGSDGLTEGR